MNKFKEWEKTCLRKKKLKEYWADDIIKRAETPLRKYICPHCNHWHVTKKMKYEPKKRTINHSKRK